MRASHGYPPPRTHIRMLLVLQSKCLPPPCNGCPQVHYSGHIHEHLGVPLFADHIRALNASFDSKLADVGNALVWQSSDSYADRGMTPSPDAKAEGGRGQQASRGHRWMMARSTKRIAFGADQLSTLRMP